MSDLDEPILMRTPCASLGFSDFALMSFSRRFSAWTLCALVFKAASRCRVVIFYEGSSPNVDHLGSPVRLQIRELMTRFSDAGVSNMHMGVDYLRDVLGMSASKLVRHPCEVSDTTALFLGNHDIHPGCAVRPTFLFVGSLIPRKGWSALIDAAVVLAQRDVNAFSIVVIGTGVQEEELRVRIASQQLEAIVHQVGPVTYEDLGS